MKFILCNSVQSFSHVWLFATPWTAACQASLSVTNSWSLLKLMSIKMVIYHRNWNLNFVVGPAAAAAKSLQSCLTLCDPIDGSPPGSHVPGIPQARTLEWVAISFSSAWKWKVKVKPLSRVWLSDPVDCSLPGSSVHGVFQARVLEWGAIAFSVLGLVLYK